MSEKLESETPSDAAACSGRDWEAEYFAADRCLMVIQTMIDHAFSADDDVPGDHVVERFYNLIAAIHPEGALPNPLSEYMAAAEGQNDQVVARREDAPPTE